MAATVLGVHSSIGGSLEIPPMGRVDARAVSDTQVEVTWTAGQAMSREWRVSWRETKLLSFSWPTSQSDLVDSGSWVDGDRHTVEGLKPDTKYRFKVNKVKEKKGKTKNGARVGEDAATTWEEQVPGSDAYPGDASFNSCVETIKAAVYGDAIDVGLGLLRTRAELADQLWLASNSHTFGPVPKTLWEKAMGASELLCDRALEFYVAVDTTSTPTHDGTERWHGRETPGDHHLGNPYRLVTCDRSADGFDWTGWAMTNVDTAYLWRWDPDPRSATWEHNVWVGFVTQEILNQPYPDGAFDGVGVIWVSGGGGVRADVHRQSTEAGVIRSRSRRSMDFAGSFSAHDAPVQAAPLWTFDELPDLC
ncbi:MAG: fibronectin type III domain-containing protein, partial [Actinomycetota bacterium]